MTNVKRMMMVAILLTGFIACKKDKDPVIIIPPSTGSTLTLAGTSTGAGGDAENSVYVDFSADKQSGVLRNSWDLGFYAGSSFKVIINSTNGATAVAVNKTDINSVTQANFDADTLALGHGLGSFAVIDDPRESNVLNKTVIKEISATESDNKVYIVNRAGGSGSTLPVSDLFKIRIIRSGQGYTLQYAKLEETTFKTINITKNSDYNFTFVSLVNGAAVNVEPEKTKWDIVWGTNTYIASPTIPYTFSDFVLINNIAGATALERVYPSSDATIDAYTKFNKDSIAKYTFSDNRLTIGGNWRTTFGKESVKQDRFYIVKDGGGNAYKLKFVSMGKDDGGTRGKPQIQYELIK